jgi:hypothetical protein
MSHVPAGTSPFVISVTAVVQVEQLVFAPDYAAAQAMADREAPRLTQWLAEATHLDMESPYVDLEIDAREATYAEVMGTTEPDHYGPLEPYFPTLVRDPDDWPDTPEIPDYPPIDREESE